MDTWKLGPWKDEPGFTYHSLQHAHIAARLDRVYFSHNVDWVPNSLQMEIDIRESLSDHLPLACTFKFCDGEKSKPKGKP